MSEEDLELLITTDDPGEDDLKVDHFDHSHVPAVRQPEQPTEVDSSE